MSQFKTDVDRAMSFPSSLQNSEWFSKFYQTDPELFLKIDFAKEYCAQLNNELDHAFDERVDITEIIVGRALAIDRLLLNIWRSFGLDDEPISLVAVGGYGRAELHPYSDIDLLILAKRTIAQSTKENIGSFITFLWDLGLPIAHAVRNIKECVDQAKTDLTIITNLIEARFLGGRNDLYQQLLDRISPSKIWPSKKFYLAKLKEQEERHKKYGDSAYRLEPNVKDGPGGLRDIQTIEWIAKRICPDISLQNLSEASLLSKKEQRILTEVHAYLWKVRYLLHKVAKRKEDRLLFEYQNTVANLLGFHETTYNKTIESFMQTYYQTIFNSYRLNQLALHHFDEKTFKKNINANLVQINTRFHAENGLLKANNSNVFKRYPFAFFEISLLLQQKKSLKGLSIDLIRLVNDNLDVIDDKFRADLRNRSLFIEILRQPTGVAREIRRLAELKILGRYWPSFEFVTGRMQYDLFHVYTVDEHTLHVLENTCKIAEKVETAGSSLYHDIFLQLPKPEILYLAALFHDVGKGRESDHSTVGAHEAEEFCLNHHLSRLDAKLVAWLVENHLVLSMIAQNRDLSDPDIINQLAKTVGNLIRLNYLYLLTICDVQGTNPKLWNSWRGALLLELYELTSKTLQRGLDNPLQARELIDETRASALQILQKSGYQKELCVQLWSELDDDYFLRHSDDEIAWHAQSLLSSLDTNQLVVRTRKITQRGGTEIFIYSKDRNYLFAHITSTLTALNLNIVDARITTSKKNHALDTFLVLDQDGNPLISDAQCQHIEDTLKDIIAHPPPQLSIGSWLVPRRLNYFNVPVKIIFGESANKKYTALELTATDFPGLLALVGKVFVEHNMLVHDARISTLGERVYDVFNITDIRHRPLQDENTKQKLKNALETTLNAYLKRSLQ